MRVHVRLSEHMTFDQLFRISDPKRVARSFTVHGPPLEIDSYQDTAYYVYNFKSNPSTTGLRHRGYIKYLKPAGGKPTPLQHLNCVVDCTCPDFRYRWAWANKQRQASRVGPNSLNQAWNRAPRKTNPSGAPGLCKHLLACREYIYGLLSSFPGDEPDTSEKLNKLTKYATKRWSNYHQQVRAAKERERVYRERRNLRNRGIDPDAGQNIEPEVVAGRPEAPEVPDDPELYTEEPADAEQLPPPLPEPGTNPSGYKGYRTKAEYDFARRRGLGDSLERPAAFSATGCVVSGNGESMNTICEAKSVVEELIEDLPETEDPKGDMMLGSEDMGMEPEIELDAPTPIPSEPPTGGAEVGAGTEGATALGLLVQIRDLLGQMAGNTEPAVEAAAVEAGADMAVDDKAEAGAADALPMPDEPPTDEAEAEGEADEDGEDEDEDKDEDGAKAKEDAFA